MKYYQRLKSIYEKSWSDEENPIKKAKITYLLKKIGHEFKNGIIQLVNESRWAQVSMQHKPFYRMPSCTNQIKSYHGYLNALTPRNNQIWTSLSRIIDDIQMKYHRFNDNFIHKV